MMFNRAKNKKTALVTGSSRGIGKAIALALAKHGLHVAINSRDKNAVEKVVSEFRDLGFSAEAAHGDVTKYKDVQRIYENLSGPNALNILVNNVGFPEFHSFESTEESRWDRIAESNLKSAFLMSREALKILKNNGCGRIVNISSVAAFTTIENTLAYSVAKSGLIALTRSLAKEVAKYNIQVNAIAPSLTNTASRQNMFPSAFSKIMHETPSGKIASPEDIADIAVFFALECPDIVTGQALTADGGLSL